MSRAFLTSIDLTQNELQNAKVQNLASAPSSPVKGQLYMNSTDNTLYYWDGGAWVAAKSGAPSGGAGGDLTGTYPNPTIGVGAVTSAKILDGTIAVGDLAFTPIKSGDVASGDLTGTYPGPTIANLAVTAAKVANATLTDTQVAAGNKDGAVGTYSMRTLGTGANQAAAGNDTRFTDARTPTGTAGGDLTGTYPNPTIATGKVTTTAILDGTIAVTDLNTGSVRLDTVGAPTGPVNGNSQRITAVADPTGAQDAATKNYVDSTAQGLDAKASVRAATTVAGTLATSFASGQVIDGITLATSDRILIKNQALAQENGIYVVGAGTPTRATDNDTWFEVPGAYVWVEVGTTQADTGWLSTADAGGTINTTPMPWVQFSGAGQITAGTGITKTGNTLSVDQTVIAPLASPAFTGNPTAPTATAGDNDTSVATTAFVTGAISTSAAAQVPTTRTISTTAPLTGGGDLSANRTLAISNFTSGAAGAVPASGGGTVNFLRADATWQPVPVGTVQKVTAACAAALSTVVATTAINSQNCTVGVYRATTPFDEVECDVEHTSNTSVTIRFATAPTAGQYNIVVTG
jgi:hypothetical protein